MKKAPYGSPKLEELFEEPLEGQSPFGCAYGGQPFGRQACISGGTAIGECRNGPSPGGVCWAGSGR